MSKKVYIVNGSGAYRALFQRIGYDLTNAIVDADLVVFTGGEDVSPHLYGEYKHPATFSNIHRDEEEKIIFNLAKDLNIPMVGICRGGQFLNVMNGGKMYQHVNRHAIHGTHEIVDVSGFKVQVSSTHHQMFRPAADAIIVALGYEGGWREYIGNLGEIIREESTEDYEVIFYPETNTLCFQPHPEFNGEAYEDMKKYFVDCLNNYLDQELESL